MTLLAGLVVVSQQSIVHSQPAATAGGPQPAARHLLNAGQMAAAYDVVVYGGTSGGITAAIQATRMGKTVLLIEPGRHLGGLTSGGLGATDIGNKAAIGGLSREFYRRISQWYQDPAHWRFEKRSAYREGRQANGETEMWTFEPHVAEAVYRQWLAEHKVPVVLSERLDLKRGVITDSRRIQKLRMESGLEVAGSMFIDATYEGDLMALAGVSYHVGREANRTYQETLNGIQVARAVSHQFTKPVDPYVKPGDPSSGLLPLISAEPPGQDGDGDRRVQAYNFRMCTTDIPENRRAWPKPPGYDPARYELLLRNCEAGDLRIPWNPIFMPNRKTDTNNNFAISTDYIGANYDYPEADYKRRQEIYEDHKNYQMGLMYTLATHPRVPEVVRAEFQRLALARDEFVDNDNWPHQMYIREARRMVSALVMTQHHCQGFAIAHDSVGMGAYNMDSHNCQRYVTPDGKARNEGDIQVGVSPYPISYRSICPSLLECENLLVPVSLAATHIAYGSIRMEPVFMVLGQSSATAACQAIDQGQPVQSISYPLLREKLLADQQVLEWKGPAILRSSGIELPSLAGLAVDDSQAKLTGNWQASSSVSGYVGAHYLHDGNVAKGDLSARYEFEIPQPGKYEIRIYYTANANRATNVAVEIKSGQTAQAWTINQRQPNEKGYAARTPVELSGKISVTISNAGTDGYVIVDAVQIVPVKM